VDSLPVAYVSHDKTVEKRVMLKYGDVPHVTQLAVATLKPTEVATKHSHKDMTESTKDAYSALSVAKPVD
jgi:hypothetical protein